MKQQNTYKQTGADVTPVSSMFRNISKYILIFRSGFD